MTCEYGPCPPVSPIVREPIVIVREHFVPQLVPVIHPIKVVDKVHCCPVEKHIFTYSEEVAAGAPAVRPGGPVGPVGPVGVRGVRTSGKSSKVHKRSARQRRRK